MGLMVAGRVLHFLSFSILMLLAVLHGSAPAAQAATFSVNSDVDEPDANPGDGQCASTPSGACTYRAAIMEANAFDGEDTINLPSGTFKTTLEDPFNSQTYEYRSQQGGDDSNEHHWRRSG